MRSSALDVGTDALHKAQRYALTEHVLNAAQAGGVQPECCEL
jgi:hypothetical protein